MAWNYSNTSVQTTLAAPVAPGDTSISIVDATGLPVSFPFSYILDYNLSTVEIVTVTNVVGSSLTVTRGQDGTSAQSHAAGGPCVHGVVARDLSDPQNHIAATSNVHGTGVGASVVGTSTAQTLTNKTISGSSNTISNIADTSILTLSATKITGSFNSVTSVGAVAVSGGSVAVTRSTGSNAAFDAQITGDTNPRGRIQADGTHLWGPGNVAPDVTLTRNNGSTTGVLSLNTELDQVVASTTYDYLNGRVTGDTNERFAVHSDGKIRWGAGAGATDTTLTRTNSRELTSNAAFLLSTSSGTNDLIKVSIDGDANARWFARGDGRLKWGDGTNSSDTFLYRNGVGILKTEGDVQFASGVNVDVGAWLTYTPTFTASTTNPTVGNGSLTGRYIYLNKHTVQAIFKFVGGSTSAKGSGAYTFSLPITAAASDGNGAVGPLRALDAGVATRVGVVSLVSSTTVQGSFHNDGSAFSASDLTGTFNGCTIYFSLVYEVQAVKLPNKLPGSLARAPGSGSLFTATGFEYSYAIGGLPFLSAASHNNPIVRETNPVSKNQFDMQNNPGEQTLAGWWIRSQQSFHGGAGQLYGDPQSLNTFTSKNEFNQVRFLKSRGVDIWTEGVVSLLPDTKQVRPGTPLPALTDATEFVFGDKTDAAFAVNGTTFFVITASGVTTPGTAPSTSISSCTTDGFKIYVIARDGLWSAPIPATTGGTWTWTKMYTVSTTQPVHVTYVKNRLMAGIGNVIYQLAGNPASPPAALPTATFTNDDPNWVYTGFTESAPAIYAIGNNGVRGSIIRLTLDNTGALPTLTNAAVAAQFPSGEVAYSAMGYLGGLVGIGTNKGVRVAQVATDGSLQYGPILFGTDGPVWAWSARDRFLWCTVSRGNDGDSGLYRIDLSVEVDTLRFAYTTDLVFGGDATDCLMVAHLGVGDSLVYGTATDTYMTDTTKLFTQGYLQTSRIRYNTLEPKLYKFVRVRGPILQGALSYQVLDQNDSLSGTRVFPEGLSPGLNDSLIDSPTGPQDHLSIKFMLNRDPVTTGQGAQFRGYQLKALPGMPRQRIIQLPLWCFDTEEDMMGNTQDQEGSAYTRLQALEALDAVGDVVILQDLNTGTNYRCVIDRVSFKQVVPPPRFQGWGGVIIVTLRTV